MAKWETAHRVELDLRAVIYREGGFYIARCLEMDLIGDGASENEAMKCLFEAITTKVEFCLENEEYFDDLYKWAEDKYLKMFQQPTSDSVGKAEGKFTLEKQIQVEDKPEPSSRLRFFLDLEDLPSRLFDQTPFAMC